MAFYEIDKSLLQQKNKPLITRWFKDDACDFFLWQTPDDAIQYFQLTFGESDFIEWDIKNGFRTGTIDEGERYAHSIMTPIVHLNSKIDIKSLEQAKAIFLDVEVGIPKEIREFILSKLNRKLKKSKPVK